MVKLIDILVLIYISVSMFAIIKACADMLINGINKDDIIIVLLGASSIFLVLSINNNMKI
jgi:hypothetical protein